MGVRNAIHVQICAFLMSATSLPLDKSQWPHHGPRDSNSTWFACFPTSSLINLTFCHLCSLPLLQPHWPLSSSDRHAPAPGLLHLLLPLLGINCLPLDFHMAHFLTSFRFLLKYHLFGEGFSGYLVKIAPYPVPCFIFIYTMPTTCQAFF